VDAEPRLDAPQQVQVSPRAVILLGGPGAGKGTQAQVVSRKLGLPHISTGEMLRKAVNGHSPQGLAARGVIDEGGLVPDEIVCGMVEERIKQPDCRRGFILDGFPRTLSQAQFLDRILQAEACWSPLVVNLRVDPEMVVKRATGRRTCPVCGTIYNIYFRPPKREGVCDLDGSPLIHRSDDKEETIRQRQVAYESQTKPLIDYYRQGSCFHDVDGNAEPEAITNQICRFLKGHDHLQVADGN